MKRSNIIITIPLLITFLLGCEQERIQIDSVSDISISWIEQENVKTSKKEKSGKIVGTLEVNWKGATKGSDMGNKPDNLLAFVELTAFEGTLEREASGEIIYRVLETDLSLHREIKAEVTEVFINETQHKAWILAKVVSDSKGCDGNGGSGHDSGCSSGDHDDGCGGTHDDSSHDGGCSHDDTGEGGCSHDDTGEGGCSGGGSPDSGGGQGAPGGGDNGNPLSGKNCRIGQILAMKMHDGGNPGAGNDGITWKWFGPDAEFESPIFDPTCWPHLCRKDIIEGNVVIILK